MPILRGSVTFARFHVDPKAVPQNPRNFFSKGLGRGAFEPIDVARGEDDRAAGFVTLTDSDSTDFAGGILESGRALFAFRVDTLRIEASAIRVELERWTAAFQVEHKRPPARGERIAAKGEIRHNLRKRAEPTTRVFDVSWALASGEILVWAASRKAVEEIAGAIETAFEVSLAPRSVAAHSVAQEIPEDALPPTPELMGLAGQEVPHV
jgi:recombination associated protein RdgC